MAQRLVSCIFAFRLQFNLYFSTQAAKSMFPLNSELVISGQWQCQPESWSVLKSFKLQLSSAAIAGTHLWQNSPLPWLPPGGPCLWVTGAEMEPNQVSAAPGPSARRSRPPGLFSFKSRLFFWWKKHTCWSRTGPFRALELNALATAGPPEGAAAV